MCPGFNPLTPKGTEKVRGTGRVRFKTIFTGTNYKRICCKLNKDLEGKLEEEWEVLKMGNDNAMFVC